LIVKEDGEYEYRFGKKGDVNPGLLRVPIGILYAKWSPVRAPIRKVSQTGIFCQTDDYIDPPKGGSNFEVMDRSGREGHQIGKCCWNAFECLLTMS
jgi:hypothetical protein